MIQRLHHSVGYFVMFMVLVSINNLVLGQRTFESFDCQIDNNEVHYVKQEYKNNQSVYPIDTIDIYLVCDYALYQQYQGDTTALLSYVDVLWHEVRSIYAYDSIPLRLSDVKIWNQPDPYNHSNALSSITSFADDIGLEFPGRLAHLLSGTQGNKGGIAYLNGYCDPSRAYGYANVFGTIDTVLNYNWDIHVLAHEIGHNLGAPHTNECIWGANHDTAIDGCGQVSTSCADAHIPTEGGTIMSSCHQYPEGIILDQGIGDAPAELMKSVIRSCGDFVGLTCNSPFIIEDLGLHTVSAIDLGNGAQQSDATNSKWYQYVAIYDQTLNIASCHQGIDTRLQVYQGGCDSLTLLGQSDDDCVSIDGFRFASKLQLSLIQGDTILIEWDDRWSTESFEFTLSIEEASTCHNGIKDGDEQGVDCGGLYCFPCANPCNDLLQLSTAIDNTIYFRTSDALQYDGLIAPGSNIILVSPEAIDLHEGFEISTGSEATMIIEDCEL